MEFGMGAIAPVEVDSDSESLLEDVDEFEWSEEAELLVRSYLNTGVIPQASDPLKAQVWNRLRCTVFDDDKVDLFWGYHLARG
ncbi:hypothetical protein KIPB_010029 [Kipferlia bialata]|uniref:Uncharacterized protein n=1 Tax=Kipferlia bialata TaxID=797122 RepID=A0A391NTX8_9EUKA|nr:hypothetical protein KIPB_010029 [Kipferlia bialata]|eukprot:g10029.t1